MSQLFLILLTIVGIGFLVFIHEAGHYLCAKMAGVRVLIFSLGFGPRLFSFRRGGTIYCISALPLGGYVRVAGEDPTQRLDMPSDGLHAKSVPARALFFTGGVLMNLLFAFIAFPVVFRAGVEFTAPVVGGVIPGSAAWEADLQPGDRVLEVNGKSMYSFENLQVELALAGDRAVPLTVQRDDMVFEQPVRPRYDEIRGLFAIGILQPTEPEIRIAVADGSPAHDAGLRTGDRLHRLAGRIADTDALREFERRYRYRSAPIAVEVRRADDELHTAQLTPRLSPLPNPELGVIRTSRRVGGLRPDTGLLRALGLQRGDHIIQVDGQRFTGGSFAPFATGGPAITMQVRRRDEPTPRTLTAKITPEQRQRLDDLIGLAPDEIDVIVVPRPGSPAERAGIRPGDAIVAAAGRPIETWADLRAVVLATPVGDSLALTVDGDVGRRQVSLQPATESVDLGFVFELAALREPYREPTVSGAIRAGMVCSFDLIKSLYVTLKKLFTGEVAAKNLGGIITISRVTYLFAESGWERFVYFLALLSLNLAVINLLPIPILDGGHLLFVLIEGIKGSPVSPKLLNYSQIVGLVFIVALLVFVTYNDILRLL